MTSAAALILGTFWITLIWLATTRTLLVLVAWPLLLVGWWLTLARWRRMLRVVGYLAILPAAVLAFEVYSALHGGVQGLDDLPLDRSHYRPGVRHQKPSHRRSIPGGFAWGLDEIFISGDGFRGDPKTGIGNPARCVRAVVGDSIVFGSGLPYQQTLGPSLKRVGLEACVFGVGGNAPANYLATLRHVAPRLGPNAPVAVYLTAANDFVWTLHGLWNDRRWQTFSDFWVYLNLWRGATFTYRLFHGGLRPRYTSGGAWEFRGVQGRPVVVLRDPASPAPHTPLSGPQRQYLRFVLDNLARLAERSRWRVAVVIVPDGDEILASLAAGRHELESIDPARVDALSLCREAGLDCHDLTPFLYAETLAAAQNPYFTDDSVHLSAFGMSLLSAHYRMITGGSQRSP